MKLKKSIPNTKELTKEELKMKELLAPYKLIPRPRLRAECVDGIRPCPFASCRHHLYLEVTEAGSLQLNFPDLEIDEIPETCSLDIADRGGGETLTKIGDIFDVSRERIRQIEAKVLQKLKRLLNKNPLSADIDTPEERLGVAAKKIKQTAKEDDILS